MRVPSGGGVRTKDDFERFSNVPPAIELLLCESKRKPRPPFLGRRGGTIKQGKRLPGEPALMDALRDQRIPLINIGLYLPDTNAKSRQRHNQLAGATTLPQFACPGGESLWLHVIAIEQ